MFVLGPWIVKVDFAWYDLWVGAYWDGEKRQLHICPLPTIHFMAERHWL